MSSAERQLSVNYIIYVWPFTYVDIRLNYSHQ